MGPGSGWKERDRGALAEKTPANCHRRPLRQRRRGEVLDKLPPHPLDPPPLQLHHLSITSVELVLSSSSPDTILFPGGVGFSSSGSPFRLLVPPTDL